MKVIRNDIASCPKEFNPQPQQQRGIQSEKVEYDPMNSHSNFESKYFFDNIDVFGEHLMDEMVSKGDYESVKELDFDVFGRESTPDGNFT